MHLLLLSFRTSSYPSLDSSRILRFIGNAYLRLAFIFVCRKDAVGRYGSLYYQSRPRALEALDSLPELHHATQLKAKILFSVVVVSSASFLLSADVRKLVCFQLAFRTCKNLRDVKLRETFRSLHVDVRTAAGLALRGDLMRCLSQQADTYPLADVEIQVRGLVCDTLKEYKCLETCMPLRR